VPPSLQSSPVRIIGIGNEYRGDDQVGRVVARALRSRIGPLAGAQVSEQDGEGTALMTAWQDARAVILIDAVSSGAAPGTIFRLDARTDQFPRGHLRCSTHAFSVAEAIALAQALNQLPPDVIIYGVEGERFAPGSELSPAVERAARVVADRIAREVRGLLGMAL
jgi:hydrogenase maturation protease